jgi:hypothetical protein
VIRKIREEGDPRSAELQDGVKRAIFFDREQHVNQSPTYQ